MVETKGQRVERLRMCAREELKAMLKIARWLQRPNADIDAIRTDLFEIADAAIDLLEAEEGKGTPLAELLRLDNDEPTQGEAWLPCPDTLPPPRAGAR